MTKYRIRLLGGRVIGPFTKNQLFELKAKGHIKGNEEGQVYPTGNWGPLSDLDIYAELIDENKTFIQNLHDSEHTFAINLDELRNKRAQQEVEEIDVTSHKPVENLTETIRIPTPQMAKPVEIKLDQEPVIDLGDDLPEGLDDSKTLINPIAQQELEKMRKLQREEDARQRAIETEHKKQMALQKVEQDNVDNQLAMEKASPDALTMVVNLDNFNLLEIAREEEILIDKQKKAYDKKKKAEEEPEEEEESPDADIEAKKKKRLIIIVAACLLGYALLFPDDDKPKEKAYQNLAPQIIFPIPFDKSDKSIAQIEFQKGVERVKGGTYPELVNAGLHFKAAYENDINNLLYLNLLARTYAEELNYSKNILEDATTMFNIVQSKRPFLMQDPNGVIGLNLFYTAIGKHGAAADVVYRYLSLKPKKLVQELFAVYLESLMKLGNVVEARDFSKALIKAPDKNQYTLEALFHYSLLNQETDKAIAYVDEAIKKYPQLVRFYLMKAELLLKEKRLKEVEALLEKASVRNLEYNDKMRAKFLEISGIMLALKGQVAPATKMLVKSLELVESNELRMKLSDLSTSDQTSPDTDKLIQESKASKLVFDARDLYEKKSYELSLSFASKAAELLPGNIPSELFLSKVQLRLGLTKQALLTLENLAKKYPSNKDVNITLIDAYIKTYKFKDAQARISVISETEIRNSWEYASVNARLFLQMGDPLRSIGWLKTSINLNPLNDEDIFRLARILLKRSNFDAVRNLLNKCMELDPINPDYRITYAEMIYETQDDKAAIGYLLGLPPEFSGNPKVLAEIAIFYFRSGQVKDFQSYKTRLEQLPTKDKALYEFLIRAALLDERYDEIPLLVEKLVEIEPGDLESMMTAGRVLFENKKFIEAAKWFDRVKERLPSYPKVQYFIARVKFMLGDYDKALERVKEDIKENGESDVALVFMGEIYVTKGELVTAENFYKKAQKINPKSYEALIGLADISTLRNNYDLALDLYQRALKERSDEPIIHRKIGDVYRLLGQGTLAIESYKMYLEMDPEAFDKPKINSYIQLMQ